MSAEACRNQASKFSLQAPHWLTRYDFGAAGIRIGQTKSVHISWNPGRNFENQMGYLLEANGLQPGLVPLPLLPSQHSESHSVRPRPDWNGNGKFMEGDASRHFHMLMRNAAGSESSVFVE